MFNRIAKIIQNPNSLIINTVWFYLVWISSVAVQSTWISAALFITYFIWLNNYQREIRTLALGLVGVSIDYGLYLMGLYEFDQGFPLWLITLWLSFVLCLDKSFYFLHGKYSLAAIIGGIAGGFNYWMASNLGAVDFGYSDLFSVTIIGLYWAIFLPTSLYLQGLWQRETV